MNGLFSSPKKLAVTIVCIVIAALVIASAGLLLIKGSLISAAEAEFVALSDAGLTRGQVSALRSDLDFDDGRWEYNVDFYSDGVEYDYAIQAKDGGIISRDIDGQTAPGQPQDTTQPVAEQPAATTQPAASDTPTAPATTPGAPVQTPQPAGNNAQQITLDDAKAAALKDAGLAAADVTFTKAKLDYDDGVAVYEVEFYSADTEYDYEINTADGTIRSRSAEALPQNRRPAAGTTTGANASTSGSHIGAEKAKAAALKDAGLNAADVTFTKAKLDYDDGVAVYEVEFYSADTEYDYEINAAAGTVRSRSSEALPQSRRPAAGTTTGTSGTTAAAGQNIGADRAKTIALQDAGLAAADVTFTKAKLDYDDGVAVYEVEFYSADTEYDYEINAAAGTVRSRSAEALPQSRRPAAGTTDASGSSTASGQNIGADRAKTIALQDARLNAADVTFTKAKLDYDDGRAEYEVEFYYGAQEYEYTIDAQTGAIIEAKVDRD